MRKKPIRVLMLVHGIYARDTRVRRYAEYLARDGNLVDIVGLASETGEVQPTASNIRVFPLPMTRVRQEGIKQVLSWALSTFLMFFYTNKLDLKNRYDVIHVNNMPDFLVFAAIIQRIKGRIVILDIHDPVPEVAESKFKVGSNHPLVLAQVYLEKISIGLSSHVITALDSFKTKLVSRGADPEKITVVLNAPDPIIFKPGLKRVQKSNRKNFVLLYLGTVAARYGVEVLIRALPIVRTTIPNVRLKIFTKIKGEGKSLDEVVELASGLGVGDILEVNDPVPPEMVPEVMMDADLGIYPAIRDCHMDVALSLKIPEMAVVGLPMVCSRLTVLEDMFGEDSIAFFPSGDYEALAQKIIQLYGNSNFRESLSKNATREALALNWETQYKKYLDLLRILVSESRNN
jgi:glycosyltransferase involved in cell wall biosynthesis